MEDAKTARSFYALCAVLTAAGGFVYWHVNRLVPHSYMDELFHVRQAQEYCRGNWGQWDPMITTPPGLYILSVGLLRASRLACTVEMLRAVNLVFAAALVQVCRRISRVHAHPHADDMSTLLVSLLPTLLPFYFLYYTDVGSVFFCLLAYYALLRERTLVFLGSAVLALLFRQTNVLWVGGFLIADVAYRRLAVGTVDEPLAKVSVSTLTRTIQFVWRRRARLRGDAMLVLLVSAVFAAGVATNGGAIVLGDRASHRASLHLAQVCYCMATIAGFSWPLWLRRTLSARQIAQFLLLLPVCWAAVRWGTIEHPYLLADNRHWTNILWRRFFRRTASSRYLFVPVYALATVAVMDSLVHGVVWQLGFFVTCAAALIPSPLIEPRYYIMPTVLFLLNCRMERGRAAGTALWLLLINGFVMGMFLYRPFRWAHAPDELQRFIW